MKRSDAFPSQYVSQADVQSRDLTVTIASIKMDEIRTGSESDGETKPVVFFREPDVKALVLNGTNWDSIADAYGPDSDGWIGKKITLYFEPNVKFGNKRVGGVRVRISPGAGTTRLTFPQLIALATTVGLSETELKTRCKTAGLTAYHNTIEDEQAVRAIIDAERVRKQQDAAAEVPMYGLPKDDDTIPF
jgi:AraC-like DNA-binding protein